MTFHVAFHVDYLVYLTVSLDQVSLLAASPATIPIGVSCSVVSQKRAVSPQPESEPSQIVAWRLAPDAPCLSLHQISRQPCCLPCLQPSLLTQTVFQKNANCYHKFLSSPGPLFSCLLSFRFQSLPLRLIPDTQWTFLNHPVSFIITSFFFKKERVVFQECFLNVGYIC